MNDIYEQKAIKYKYKYLKLKNEYFGEGGGFKTLFGLKKSKEQIAREEANALVARKKAHQKQFCNENNEECNKCYDLWYTNKEFHRQSYDKKHYEREQENDRLDRSSSILKPFYSFKEFYLNDGCPSLAQVNEEEQIVKDNEAKKEAERRPKNEEALKEQESKKIFNSRVEKCMMEQRAKCETRVENEIEQENKPYVVPESKPQWDQFEEMKQIEADRKIEETERRLAGF